MDNLDPQAIFSTLNRHGVAYLVIGGHAVACHGHVRATEDLDIIFQRSPAGEKDLAAALAEMDACWIGNEIDPATGLERLVPANLSFIRSSHLMMLHTKHGYLDIFDYIPGMPELPVEPLFATSLDFAGFRVVSLDWLLRIKKAAGRPRDLEDIAVLAEGVH
jgi:hypothetical protein